MVAASAAKFSPRAVCDGGPGKSIAKRTCLNIEKHNMSGCLRDPHAWVNLLELRAARCIPFGR
eukprot:8491418-Pyramimonas_sp.AAC.1